MSEKMGGLDEARAALAARFEDTWRRVWNRDPLKSQIEGFIKAEVDAAVKVAREDAEANAKRAEAAERAAKTEQEDASREREAKAGWIKRAEAAEAEVHRVLGDVCYAFNTGEACAKDGRSRGDDLMRVLDRVAFLARDLKAREAEVARLKALLEAKQPYAPRVGDVVKVQEYRFVFTGPMLGDPDWFGNDTLRGWDLRAKRRDAWSSTAYFRYLRRATAEERAAAGLPAEAPAATEGALAEAYAQGVVDGQKHQVAIASNEAPAAPRVLPEHLAWIEAHAASWEGEVGSMTRADKAARALVAAVARRDGGAK